MTRCLETCSKTNACYILFTRCLHYRVAFFIIKSRPVRFMQVSVTHCYKKRMLACSLCLPLKGKAVSVSLSRNNVKHHLLVCADDVNVWGGSVHAIKENRET